MADLWANTTDDTWGQLDNDKWFWDITVAVSNLTLTFSVGETTVTLGITVAVSALGLSFTEYEAAVSTTQDVTVAVSSLGLGFTEYSGLPYFDSFVSTAADQWVNVLDEWYGLAEATATTVPVSALTLGFTLQSALPSYNWTVYIGDSLRDEAGNVIRDESGVPIFTEAPVASWTIGFTQYSVTVGIVAGKTVSVSANTLGFTIQEVSKEIAAQASNLTFALALGSVTPALTIDVSQLGLTWAEYEVIAGPNEATALPEALELGFILGEVSVSITVGGYVRRRGLLTGVY